MLAFVGKHSQLVVDSAGKAANVVAVSSGSDTPVKLGKPSMRHAAVRKVD